MLLSRTVQGLGVGQTTFASLIPTAPGEPVEFGGPPADERLSAIDAGFTDQGWHDRKIEASVLAELVKTAAAKRCPVTIVGVEVDGDLDLQRLEAHAPIRFLKCWFRGSLVIEDADLHELDLRGSRLDGLETGTGEEGDAGPERPAALHAPRLRCLELCVRDVVASSQLQLYAAQVGGDLRADGLVVRGPRAARERTWAIQLTNASIAYDFGLDHAHLCGGVNLGGATIGGQFRCYGTHIDVHDVSAGRPSLSNGIYAQRTSFGESVFCGRPRGTESAVAHRRFSCSGVVSFKGATIGGSLFLRGGIVDASVTEDPAAAETATGAPTVLDLDGARIEDRLVLLGLTIRGGALDLRHCSVGRLEDRPETWDRIESYHLAGFTYGALESWPRRRRRRWVESSRDGKKPGPYLELARAFAAAGDPSGERRARITASAKAATCPEKFFLGPFRYGYRPWTVVIPLLALALLTGLQVQQLSGLDEGFVQRARTQPPIDLADCATAALPCPNAALYALDAITPPDLRQVSTWQPNEALPRGRSLGLTLTVASVGSWLLVGVLVAAVAGVLKRT
jgi:hypothetical protein